MAEKYICITQCYYMGKLWNEGEELPDGLEPNKHFTLGGVIPSYKQRPMRTAADDPRSNKQLRQELFDVYGIEFDEDTPRKQMFIEWVKRVNNDPKKVEESLQPEEQPRQPIDTNVRTGKRLSDMLPDELMGMKNVEISDFVLKRYSIELRHIGSKKEDLLEKAIAIEKDFYNKKTGAQAL